MSTLSIRAAVPALVLVLAAACSGETPSVPTPPADQGPVGFVIVSGDGQTGPAGEELAQPLVVRAQNAAGAPVAGRHVAFHVMAGGGEMYVGGGVTNAEGIVKDYWTLGRVALDSQRVEARTVDPVTGAKQVLGSFTATSVAGSIASILKLTPNRNWSRPVGSLVLDTLRVALLDRFGNRIQRARVAVQWTPSNGGSTSTTSGITYTDSQGVAVTRWRMSTTPGPQTLEVSVPGAAPTPAYTATAVAGAPASIVAVDSLRFTGLGIEATVTADARDSYGNPAPYTFRLVGSNVQLGSDNVVTAVANGTGLLIATAGKYADTIVVTVQQEASNIHLRSIPATMKVGSTLPLDWRTVMYDTNGVLMPNGKGIWSSTNPAVASVNADGIITTHTTGTFKFVVSRDGVTRESTTITVVP